MFSVVIVFRSYQISLNPSCMLRGRLLLVEETVARVKVAFLRVLRALRGFLNFFTPSSPQNSKKRSEGGVEEVEGLGHRLTGDVPLISIHSLLESGVLEHGCAKPQIGQTACVG